MDQEKLLSVARKYISELETEGIQPHRLPVNEFLSRDFETRQVQALSHALYLLQNLFELANEEGKSNKIHRHFSSAQMMLLVAEKYTIEELMKANKPSLK